MANPLGSIKNWYQGTSSRGRKKARIAGVYLIIFALIGYGLWAWLGPEPVVAPPQAPEIKPLQVLETRAIALRPGFADLYARIKNPNPEFGVADLAYTWRVFDKAGGLILSRPDRDFVLPQSEKILVIQAVKVSSEVGRIEIELRPERWVGIKDYLAPRLFVTRKSLKTPQDPALGTLVLEGEAANRSNFDFDRVLIKAVLKDNSGQIITVGQHEIRTLVAGESRFFRISWFDPLPVIPTQIQAVAETNVFINENFIKSKGILQPFQVPTLLK
jgi:hypothetical protein